MDNFQIKRRIIRKYKILSPTCLLLCCFFCPPFHGRTFKRLCLQEKKYLNISHANEIGPDPVGTNMCESNNYVIYPVASGTYYNGQKYRAKIVYFIETFLNGPYARKTELFNFGIKKSGSKSCMEIPTKGQLSNDALLLKKSRFGIPNMAYSKFHCICDRVRYQLLNARKSDDDEFPVLGS